MKDDFYENNLENTKEVSDRIQRLLATMKKVLQLLCEALSTDLYINYIICYNLVQLGNV